MKVNNLPYSRQRIIKKDIDAVSNALQKDFITTGSSVVSFENKLSFFCNSKYALTTNSATSALHLACLALRVKNNDIVWCSANTFVATSNSALFCGAKIDFIDINLEDYNICLKALKNKLQITVKKKRPKVLIVTHIAGYPCSNLEEIYKLSKIYRFKIIEDASHAFGAKHKSNFVGSCKYSSVTVFSFHPIKTITTGEGGACLTNDKKLYLFMRSLRSHGILQNVKRNNFNKFYYEQHYLGFNYRMSDINASLGLSQIDRLNDILKKREFIANFYRKKLNMLEIFLTKKNKYIKSSNHLFIIRLLNKKLIKNHKNIINDLLKKKILVNIHYYPVYLQPFYKKMGFRSRHCPNSETYYHSSFSIPIYEQLKKRELNFVVKNLKEIVNKYSK